MRLKFVHFKKTVARILFLSKLWYFLFRFVLKVPQFWRKRDSRNCLLKMNGLYFTSHFLCIFKFSFLYFSMNLFDFFLRYICTVDDEFSSTTYRLNMYAEELIRRFLVFLQGLAFILRKPRLQPSPAFQLVQRDMRQDCLFHQLR